MTPIPHNQLHPADLSEMQLRQLLDSLDDAKRSPESKARRSRRLPFRSQRVLVGVVNRHEKDNPSFWVATRNISSHGLAFLHKQVLMPGQELQIEIPLIDDQSLHLAGRVVRCRHLRGMLHEIGVEFVRVMENVS